MKCSLVLECLDRGVGRREFGGDFRLWKKCLIALLSMTLAIESVAGTAQAAISTSAGHSINNDTPGVDYKLSESEQKEILQQLKFGYMSNVDADESSKYLNTSTDRVIEDSSESFDKDSVRSKEYLIKHNLLEQRKALRWGSGTFETVSYNTKRKQWNMQFETLYNDAYKSVSDSGASPSVVAGIFSSYVNTILSSSLFSGLGWVTDSKISTNSIENNLKRRRDTFKKSVKGKSKLVAVEKFQKAMESLKRYAIGFKPADVVGDDDYVNKTDFLPLLSKAAWGSQKSRPIVFREHSVRNKLKYSKNTPQYWNHGIVIDGLLIPFLVKDYWDGGTYLGDADFSDGDYYYFVSSNVYELYYKDLVDKGFLKLKDFGTSNAAKAFKRDYQAGTKDQRPVWSDENGLCSAGVDDSLGATMNVTEDGMSYKRATFFEDEDLTSMDVYQWIERVLRASEKDITSKEADIITYKYGLKYLQVYHGSELKTLKFLIAKGILNFEDTSQFESLNSPMTYNRLYQLLYRVACKNARYDFSQVTLTDSESYWMDEGYAESEISVNQLDSDFVIDVGEVEEVATDEEESADSGFSSKIALACSWLSNRLFGSLTSHVSAEEKKEYVVAFKLSKDVDWSYDNVSVPKIANGKEPKSGVTVKSQNMNYNGKKISVWVLTAKVQANRPAAALKLAKSRLTCKVGQKDRIDTVTKLSGDSTEYTMISQSSLKKSFSNISVLEDKVLLNTSTGSQAVLFPDLGYAMVGNTVVQTKGIVCQNSGSEVFYNLKIIVSLLDDTFMQKIGASTGVFKIPKKLKTYMKNVATEYDNAVSKVTCTTLKVTDGMLKSADDDDSSPYSKGDNVYYYRLNDLTDGVNTMMRQYKVKRGNTTVTMYLVVDWQFAIPSIDDYATEDVMKAFEQKKNLTQAQVTKWLYTRPKNSKTLTAWWDSNYAASNALINFMCGTTKVNYVTSGWLTPSISILMPNKKTTKQETAQWAAQLFKGISICSYKGGTTEDGTQLASYFGSGTDWSTWFTTFYNPDAAFVSVEKGASEATLSSMCRRYRTCNYYFGDSVKTYGGYSYGMNFFITKAGVAYRNTAEDDRVHVSYAKGKVTKFRITTRSDFIIKPKVNSTVVSFKTEKGKVHKFLYRGSSKNGTIKLTPIDKPIRANVSTKNGKVNRLYNGCFFAADSSGVTLAVDRGDHKSSVLDSGYWTRKKNSSDAKATKNGLDGFARFSTWQSLYQTWANEYLGSGRVSSKGLRFYDAFSFNSACVRASEREGFNFGSLDSFINLSKKTANALKKNPTYVKGYQNAITFAKGDSVMRKYAGFNSGLSDNVIPSAGLDFFKNTIPVISNTIEEADTRIKLNPVDSTKNGKIQYVIGNRVSYSLSCLQSGGVYRPAWLREDSSKKIKLPATIQKQYTVFAVPQFSLSEKDWSINVDDSGAGTLIDQGTIPAINFSNYYYSGILHGIQETIIAKYVRTGLLSDVSAGSVLSLAGIRFKVDPKSEQDKDGVWLTSVCLQPEGSRKELLTTAMRWGNGITAQVAYKTQVKNLLKDTMVKCDGVLYPLTNYIKDKTKDGEKSGIQVGSLTESSMAKKYGLVYSKANKIYCYKKGKSKPIKKSTGSYKCVRVRVKLDGNLKVRALTDDGNKFALAQITINGNIGMDDDALMFYEEDLSYDSKQIPSVGIENMKFNPSAAFTQVKQQFLRMYAEAFAGDLKVLILAIICSMAIYLSVISWIAYLVLHYRVMDNLFRVLASGRNGFSGTGFDIVKFFSLGVYSLDDDPPLYRIVIIQLICAIVASVCVNMVG